MVVWLCIVKNGNRKNNSGSTNILTGIIKVAPKPIGFLLSEKEGDIVFYEENLNCALDKDEVEVEIIGKDGGARGKDRKKGRVVRIIERNKTNFVGTVEMSGKNAYLLPDDYRFYKKIELRDFPKDLKNKQKVFVQMDNWNNPNINPTGKVLKVIGEKGVHETEMQSILLDKGIVYDFPPEVEKEAERVAEEFRSHSFQEGQKNLKQNSDSSSLKGSHGAQNFVSGFSGIDNTDFVAVNDQGKVSREQLSDRDRREKEGIFQQKNTPVDREEPFPWSSRKDFRNITTFTIDPVDAKDFDDALSYRDLGEGKIEVGVHIADVSHFVRPGSELDKESRKRAFSTYLVDRTIPMLPEVLSNELCSLMPNVDRFAFSSVFEIEKATGKILNRWFGKTIINSDKRFSYEEAQGVLDAANGQNSFVNEPSEADRAELEEFSSKKISVRENKTNFAHELQELNRIANIYRKENKKNGAIEFETDEVRFELDSEGKPLRVYKKPRLDTMKMIEEWMLLANREVAKFLSDKTKVRGGASIFRIHNFPKMERIEELAVFVRALGHDLPVKDGQVSAKDINALLSAIEGHPAESLIKTATIRSMAKAVYSTKNIGHFGLAFEYYTHFTSPIRRYPDLLIHRILENHLGGGKISKDEMARFEKISMECSDREITVQEAERESIRYKQVEFMEGKEGQIFDCTISGVSEWGVYVEVKDTKVEGMVRLRDIEGDMFVLNEKNYCVVGQKTGKKYSLGDSVKAQLISTNLDRKILDFKLVS